ncbi:putative phytosulfokines 6 [Camellia lanceoleosa]|uniref:Phytosulfokines 6 n=1 Tax=Camellia lanceoleosa TaxID=1840588 RepID=A0ACC0F8F0_9ERIC|nr:putative phytosulfokines 6 [Camellia lanceoleosa]
MKQNTHSIYVMFFIIFLVTTSQTVARFLATKQGEKETKLNEITTGGSLVEVEENDSLNQLMGVEECQNRDEDCLKRRMVAEAHLDYIYTQHHKP